MVGGWKLWASGASYTSCSLARRRQTASGCGQRSNRQEATLAGHVNSVACRPRWQNLGKSDSCICYFKYCQTLRRRRSEGSHLVDPFPSRAMNGQVWGAAAQRPVFCAQGRRYSALAPVLGSHQGTLYPGLAWIAPPQLPSHPYRSMPYRPHHTVRTCITCTPRSVSFLHLP